MKQVNITYQDDAIIGAASISTSTPPPLHLPSEGQSPHQSAGKKQGLHSTENPTLITAPSDSGFAPSECSKGTSLALHDIGASGSSNPDTQVLPGTKAPQSPESSLPSTSASLADLEKAQVHEPKTKRTKRSDDNQSDSTRKMIQMISIHQPRRGPRDSYTSLIQMTRIRVATHLISTFYFAYGPDATTPMHAAACQSTMA
ncbi:hypothetical protein PVAP13_6NG080100 [Panicum virgatum]|uniref:Uncharacterized protein n=1 Tax=Panicum virgatum TaxID=38727 RepID=A0A8T0QVD7_PANVG|nr:hypothetical protein PVAP13_6NG080100 [Panicum virgatum]